MGSIVAGLLAAEAVGELRAGADAELPVDVPEVEVDRLRAQEELGGGLLVRRAAGDDERDLELLRRQPLGARRVVARNRLP